MKYIAVLGALFMVISTVAAVDMVIDPQMVTMGYTDTKDATVCVYRGDGSPYAGLDLVIGDVCKDLDGDEACSIADGDAAGLFSASVIDSPTDSEGCGVVRLDTTDAQGGIFVYKVNGYNAGVFVNEEGGLVYIPEFGVFASAAVLGAAGLYIYRRRR